MNTWTHDEQDYLRQLKEQQNIQSWTVIADSLNDKFGSKDKNGKQCRERYINFMRPGLDQQHLKCWSHEEELKLFQLYEEYGARWTLLSSFIKMKSQNSIKNKFYGCLRKLVRRLNEIGKKQLHLKKNIKYDSLLKPLEVINVQEHQISQRIIKYLELRKQILSLIKLEDDITLDQGTYIIRKINQFNLQTRSLKFKKKKNTKKHQLQPQIIGQGFAQSYSIKHQNRGLTNQPKQCTDQSSSKEFVQNNDQDQFEGLINQEGGSYPIIQEKEHFNKLFNDRQEQMIYFQQAVDPIQIFLDL